MILPPSYFLPPSLTPNTRPDPGEAHLQLDQDTNYVQAFDNVFTGEGRTIKKTPIKSPNLQAFVERFIQTLKHEVLNGFCVINEQHLDHILRIGADWYNRRRGHSGRDHLPPVRDEGEPPMEDLAKHRADKWDGGN